ncbi:MAG: ASKHA domain-containing protein [Desulfotomaculaceae bacterium]|nr:ASKHA domain-containing protein [Desulfotomaculaceae bacterium]
MPKYTVQFLPDNIEVTVTGEDSILRAITKANIPLNASCGGKGTCKRCKVLVKKGKVKSPAGSEQEKGYLLACRCYPESDLIVEIPEESRLTEHQVALDGGLHLDGNGFGNEDTSVYREVSLKIAAPGPNSTESDMSRLVGAIRAETGIEHLRPTLDMLRALPRALRQAGGEVTVFLAEDRENNSVEIAGVEPGSMVNKYYGLALDLGTTTVVVHLIDLGERRVVDARGAYNKQAMYGDDVITRIIYADEYPDGLEKLREAAVSTINGLIGDLAQGWEIEPEDIKAAVCAGNTTMIHLFLGLTPTNIRLEPYTPVANIIPPVRASQAGLDIHPQAWVRCVPGVASYVGGDVTAGVLACGMALSDELVLFVDIGTNGEMALGNREWLVSCACSAGPAFEGGGIRHGMRAMRGAIEQVTIEPGSLEVKYATVSAAPPVGICGSGLIDCIARLYKAGVINRGGNFIVDAGSPRIRNFAEGKEFVLAWAGETGSFTDITISEAEVKNLLRSKAAIYAGIRSMLKMVGLPFDAVDRVVVAGGFGRHINIRDAINIGMLPDMPLEKYTYIGNSSVKGAGMVLLSRRARDLAGEIAGKMTYIELSTGNTFMEEFVSALFVPHTDLGLFPSCATSAK